MLAGFDDICQAIDYITMILGAGGDISDQVGLGRLAARTHANDHRFDGKQIDKFAMKTGGILDGMSIESPLMRGADSALRQLVAGWT